jgi:hypothetical protein
MRRALRSIRQHKQWSRDLFIEIDQTKRHLLNGNASRAPILPLEFYVPPRPVVAFFDPPQRTNKVPCAERRLDGIGFVWHWRDYLWKQNFAALLKFKRRKGHCCVPTFHKEGDLQLGYWVATQRKNKNEMSVERRTRLNKIGFLWSVFMGPIAYRPRPPPRGRAQLGRSKEARQ